LSTPLQDGHSEDPQSASCRQAQRVQSKWQWRWVLHAQVFAQPIFETVEQWIATGKHRLADRPVLMRALVRCAYVAFTCFMAILIPFFGDLMGCARTPAHCATEAVPPGADNYHDR